VTNDGTMLMSPKQNSNRSCESSKTSQINRKLFVDEAQMVACFLGKTGHIATVPLKQRRTVNFEWYTTIGLRKVFGEIRRKI